MDTNSKMFNDHLKLQRKFEASMENFDKHSQEKRALRYAEEQAGDAASEHGTDSHKYAQAKVARSEAHQAFWAARREYRQQLVEAFEKQSIEMDGPGFEAWQEIYHKARFGVSIATTVSI